MRGYHKGHQHHRRAHRHGGMPYRRGYGAERQAHGHPFRRRFATREERIARLETYLGELQSEAVAVEERIAELQAVSNS